MAGVFMKPKTEQRIAAQLAKLLAMVCVRNTFLEDIHAGISPVTKTGDYSDVKVIDGEGTEIPWAEVSRISDEEMKRLMKEVVNLLYTWHIKTDELASNPYMTHFFEAAQNFDKPELDKGLLRLIQKEYKQF